MKPNYSVFVTLVLVLFLFLLSSSSTSARLLLPAEQVTDGGDLPKPQGQAIMDEDFSSLMGSDEEKRCDDAEEEECLKRRMMGEAHLDYIYTQHHKP